MLEADEDRLMRHVRRTIDLSAAKGAPSYWASLPLCIIDSVFSIRAKYNEVVYPLVIRWCVSCGWDKETPTKPAGDLRPTVADFIDVVEARLSRGISYAELFGNRQRTSSRSGILKAEAVHRFAQALVDCGVNTFKDLSNSENLEAAEVKVKQIPGQGSGITFTYFLMLAGDDDLVKADTHVRRFASDALCVDWNHLVSRERVSKLVRQAAASLKTDYPGLTASRLDYAIWSHQRLQTRPFEQASTSNKTAGSICL